MERELGGGHVATRRRSSHALPKVWFATQSGLLKTGSNSGAGRRERVLCSMRSGGEVRMKAARRTAFVLAVAAAGAVAGFALGLYLGQGGQQWAAGVESRYARDMFCYAPPGRAQQVLSDYRKQLEARRDDSFLWKREYSVLLASAASLAEKSDRRAGAWQQALAACQKSGAKSCSEEQLRREVLALCSRGDGEGEEPKP